MLKTENNANLQIFRQFRPASIAWIHGDENSNSGNQRNFFSLEKEPFLFVANRVLYRFYLRYNASVNRHENV